MRYYLIIIHICLFIFGGCINKVKENKNAKRKTTQDNSRSIDGMSSGVFMSKSSGYYPIFFSLCQYVNKDGSLCLEPMSFHNPCNPPIYYELSESHASSYVCGKLYPLHKTYKNRAEVQKDSIYSFIDSKGYQWETYYVSDTTETYGYFYVQRFSWKNPGDKGFVSSNFYGKVKIVMGKKGKINNIEGFYESISRYPFRRLSDEDIRRR